MAKVIIEVTLTQGSILRKLAIDGKENAERMLHSEHLTDQNKPYYQEQFDSMVNVLTVLS